MNLRIAEFTAPLSDLLLGFAAVVAAIGVIGWLVYQAGKRRR